MKKRALSALILLMIAALISGCGSADVKTASGIAVDISIKENYFVGMINDIAVNPDAYIGKNIAISGYALFFEAEGVPTQFAIVRNYICCDVDSGPYGFDCYYEGELPSDNDWISVVGTLASYEGDDGYLHLMLMVQELTVHPESERGAMTVTA